MDIRLDGKSAVITGGSKGLGLAMAQRFAASGADVAILARTPETLAEAKRQIQTDARGKVATVGADVSKAADIRRAYDQVMSELGKIDILVNNAGQGIRGPSEELTDEVWQADLDLKLFAQIRLNRLVFPQMKERRWGRIINVLNLGAKAPVRTARRPRSAVPRKWRSPRCCRARARRTTFSSTRCMSGSLSATRSSAATSARAPMSRSKNFIARAGRDVPLGRMGRAEEFANIACFLVSDAASYVTGCAINVDGGRCPVV
jgi:NAD(P)-dependent dehydrogenase (short-subunit alcohol dehydrogenase family)